MQSYILLAIGFRFLVDTLLFMGVNKLSGVYANPLRSLFGAVAASLYGVCCFIPGLAFLNSIGYHILFLLMTCWAAFDVGKEAYGKWLLYCLVKISLECLTANLGGIVNLCSAAVLCMVCIWAISGRNKKYLSVELEYRGNTVKIQALYDTGNLLRDPVTGKPVLIVNCDTAKRLTGLSAMQLEDPVKAIGLLPGLRLIPYRTVAMPGGILLALEIKHTKIGKYQGSRLVAFAPGQLDESGKFQALIGGAI